jgi:hypothetical protein
VILSGKPSEIPRIRNSLMRHLPLPTQRIVSVKDFPAGTWYPFRTFEENRILDAKTCTVVGAALYQDMLNHAQEGIRVRDATDYRAPPPSFWGIVNEGMDYDAFHRSLIFQPADCNAAGAAQELHSQPKEIEVSIPCRIGRMLSPQPGLRPEPVYELRYRGAEPMAPGRPFAAKVTLQWYSRAGEGEGLALKKTRILASDPLLDPDRVELRLNTLMHDSFWLDDPQFDTRAFPRQPADT